MREMVKIVAATCPRCGAGIDVPSDLRKAHCVYCGASVIIGVDGTQKAECRICDGFGRLEVCRACNGTGVCGWLKVGAQVRNHRTATFITQGDAHCENGKCSACNGTGKSDIDISCAFCDGRGNCPLCYGSGKCPACHGVGVIPDPKGSEMCYACHGAGIVNIERANIRWGERCPVCRVSIAPEGSFCTHCGKAHKCPKCGKEWTGSSEECESCGYKRGTKP
jgi:RecJ-like exonuclease/DNA-directed RNA polymerase subunit RPC12/RpoP